MINASFCIEPSVRGATHTAAGASLSVIRPLVLFTRVVGGVHIGDALWPHPM